MTLLKTASKCSKVNTVVKFVFCIPKAFRLLVLHQSGLVFLDDYLVKLVREQMLNVAQEKQVIQ